MKFIKTFISAFQFLTVIPLPITCNHLHLKKSIVFFPMVGAFIGLVVGFTFQFLMDYFNPGLASTLTILTYIILTRGLHLDGFMDTIDGFFSKKDSDTILKIMKESTVGSFAVLGAGVWFLIFFSAFTQVSLKELIVVQTLSRFNIILLPLIFSYPRQSGTGKFFVENVNIFTFIGALAMAAMLIFLVNPRLFLIYLLISLFVSLSIGYWSHKKINGITGDILGFTTETTNLVLLLFLTIDIPIFL
jgi:adenosylcobinamide-GDP ribazoletransferase